MTDSLVTMPMSDDDSMTVKLVTKRRSSQVFTVILKPYNPHFQTRTLEIRDKSRIKIGRQTSSKTLPSPYNGYFDSKVLSRQHAEIFCDKQKVYIRDIKSSNGTFVNGYRLSGEGEESEPYEIRSNDMVEFGVDIDNMYHKVSCVVYIYPLPLSQVDDNILQEIQQPLYETKLSRKSSVDTISSQHSVQYPQEEKKAPNRLESVLLQLQNEIEKSKRVQDELKGVKETILDLDRTVQQDNKHNLQHRLNEAEMTIKSFHEKWKYQQQSIETAKGEIRRLEKQVSELNAVKLKLTNELEQEIKKSKLLEEQLNNNKIPWMQTKNIQFIFALLVGVISTLVYILYH
ncbi:Putative Cytoplasm to vacuole targeting protein Vps64 [Rhizopus microsporus]|nr:Putative Cytoplasm to vacuole targeting protein Vps64 [Rhizopus microsporus]